MPYKYILGGVALAATGYGLNRYLRTFTTDNYERYKSRMDSWQEPSPYPARRPEEEYAELSQSEIDGKFLEKLSIFHSKYGIFVWWLLMLQTKLEYIKNLPELESSYSFITKSPILKLANETYKVKLLAKNYTKSDLQFIADINFMLEYISEAMIIQNMEIFDYFESKQLNSYEQLSVNQKEFVIKMLELNNVCTRAVIELNKASIVEDMERSFKGVSEVYKRFYDKKIFREQI